MHFLRSAKWALSQNRRCEAGGEMPGTGFSGGILWSEIFWNEKIGMLNAVS